MLHRVFLFLCHRSSPAENGESNHVEVCYDIFIALCHNYVFFFEIFMQQESIVREIEEALRKEIIAASTLPERPRYQ